jgi:hypothetical protein
MQKICAASGSFWKLLATHAETWVCLHQYVGLIPADSWSEAATQHYGVIPECMSRASIIHAAASTNSEHWEQRHSYPAVIRSCEGSEQVWPTRRANRKSLPNEGTERSCAGRLRCIRLIV